MSFPLTMRVYVPFAEFDSSQLSFALAPGRDGKPQISMTYRGGEVAVVSAPSVTWWPRVTGDGNFGTMFGPSDASKAKFTLDLSDSQITEGQANVEWEGFAAVMTKIDEALLDFVLANQERILKRKDISREALKMLQIRAVREKYDKLTNAHTGNAINLSTPKMVWDGTGKTVRPIVVCDHRGQAIPNGTVAPGDVVAATIFANSVYTGVGGDKFGIQWGFEDVSVICQRSQREPKTEVAAFVNNNYSFARDYTVSDLPVFDAAAQFGEAIAT